MGKYTIINCRTDEAVITTDNQIKAVDALRQNETDYYAVVKHNGKLHEVHGAFSLASVSFL